MTTDSRPADRTAALAFARHIQDQAASGAAGSLQARATHLGWKWSRHLLGRPQWATWAAPNTAVDDTPMADGWRERVIYLGEQEVTSVKYSTCRSCRTGWVESPYTPEPYLRCGLASALLAALRAEHPRVKAWHTAGGHFRDSLPFWAAVGAGILGGYQQRDRCQHMAPWLHRHR